MIDVSKLEILQTVLLDQVSESLQVRDVAAVARWSRMAEECEQLIKEARVVEERANSLMQLVYGQLEKRANDKLVIQVVSNVDDSILRSARNEGERARLLWVEHLRVTQNIVLIGSGKRYRSGNKLSIGVVFGWETAQNLNRWSLSIPDQAIDVAVLLCGTIDDKFYDILLPVTELQENWARLNRSYGLTKFTIKKDARGFILSIPHNNPLIVTQYVSNYDVFR